MLHDYFNFSNFFETNAMNPDESDNIMALQQFFKSECDRFSRASKDYSLKCQRLYSKLLAQVVRREYSVGGELIPRGYYCPSPIYDIVTGNCKRGKLIKNKSSLYRHSFEYCFDDNDKLIIVNYLFSNSVEILDYNEGIVTGIAFSKDNSSEIVSLIECCYDNHGHIISYAKANGCHNDCNIDQIEYEKYMYNDSGLYQARVIDYLDNDYSGIINEYKYSFEHDIDGYLQKYQLYSSPFESAIYKVKVKRRI